MYSKIMIGCIICFLFLAGILFQMGIGWVGAACLLVSAGFGYKFIVLDEGRDPGKTVPIAAISCKEYGCRGRINVINVEKPNVNAP